MLSRSYLGPIYLTLCACCAGDAAVADTGGLHALFSMALGGLVGTTPHMIAASVMALARLVFEFAGGRSWASLRLCILQMLSLTESLLHAAILQSCSLGCCMMPARLTAC